MPACLTRRASFLLPFLLAACGHKERTDFPPLRYNFLPPIRLNVASITVEQRFYPSGVVPDVTALDPVHPVEALLAMANDRLQALGAAGQAVFGITNASLTRDGDLISCALAVELEIYPTPGVRAGFARAIASRQHTGPVDDLRGTLYDVTKAAMDAMNVEFEYQVRNNLEPWLLPASATPSPVQQQPLNTGPPDAAPGGSPTPAQGVAPLAPQPLGLPPLAAPQATPPTTR
jgi:hypothetical protein